MSLPGLLIEYLITGAICLAWIVFGFGFEDEMTKYGTFSLILIPIAYVLGMAVDNIAYLLTYLIKNQVRDLVEKRHYRDQKQVAYKSSEKRITFVKMAINYSHLNAEMNMRSSRDRIARGMIVNALCITFFLRHLVSLTVSLSILFISILSWFIFEYCSYRFFLSAYDQIKDDELRRADKG